MAQFDLTTALADAAFNAEKKRRKYDLISGYYVDPKTGVASPDVQPFERPGFLARTFSPEAQQLIGYNRQWVDKPREAKLARNIDLAATTEKFNAMTPQEKALLGTPERSNAVFGTGNLTGQALSAHEEGMAKVREGVHTTAAQAANQQAQADAVEQANRVITQRLLADQGVPASRAKTAALEQTNRQQNLIADSSLINPRANLESVELGERLKDVTQVSPFRRQATIGQLGSDIARQQQVDPALIANEVAAAQNNAMKLRGEAARLPLLNNAALDQALVAETLSGVDATNRGLIGDTRRDTLIGDRIRAEHMGLDPVEAMTSDLGVYGRLNPAGDMEVRQSLLGYDDMGNPRMQPSQSTYSINGQPVPAPPQQLSSPIGVIPSGAARGPIRAPIGAPANIPATSPLAPTRQATLAPTSPIAAPGWSMNDMVKGAAARAGVRQLPPEEKAQSEALFKEIINDWKSLPEGGQARTEAVELLHEALADEAGILRESIGSSNLFKSAQKTVRNAIDKDPIIAERVNNLRPYQIARIKEKVRQQLIDKGLIRNDRVN